MKVEIFLDGAANNHIHKATGKAPMGVGIYVLVDGREYWMRSFYTGFGTSMEAEWTALIMAMKVALLMSEKFAHERVLNLRLYNDNEVVVNQFNIHYYNKDNYMGYYQKVLSILKKIKSHRSVTVKWIPREQNEKADLLSKEARKYGENLLRGFEYPKIPYENFW